VSFLKIKIGSLYALPWCITATINSREYIFSRLKENDLVVPLSYKESHSSVLTKFYEVKILLPSGLIGTVDVSEAAINDYWRLIKV